MTRSRHILSLAATLLAVASVVATPAHADKKDNTVRFAYQGSLPNIDPNSNNGFLGGIVAAQVWDALFYRDPETGEYIGDLATAWKWADEKTLEIDLRQGVKFHNGAPFDADDVVYTLTFAANPKNKSAQFSSLSWIARVEKLGPYKVKIVAKRTYPAALAVLATPRMAILPHRYYADVGSKGMNVRPIGTGPYRVVEHALGKHVQLERNPDFFKGGPKAQPKIEKVEIRFLPDEQTEIAEVVAGGLDLIMQVARDQAEQMRGVRNVDVVSGRSRDEEFLRMNSLPNTPAQPLRDVRVRQAIFHAIDRETMVKYLIGEGAQVLNAECHPVQFGCEARNVHSYAYNPARARQLLAEAGYPNGFDIDLYAHFDRINAEAVIGYLGAVGIRAHLHFLRTAAFADARRRGKTALAQESLVSFYDVAQGPPSVSHEFSREDLNRDPEVRDLMLKGDSSMDPTVRKEAYARALALIADRAYVVPLYTKPAYYVAAKGLSFRPPADGIPKFYEMSWK